MIFGVAIPILYPITLIALLNSYLCDKMTLIYFYRAPIKYDTRLTMRAQWILKWAPLYGLCFSYWVLGNPSIFKYPSPLLFASEQFETPDP